MKTVTCYLVARFDATVDPPVLVGVGTYGEGWRTLTLSHSSNQFYADLEKGEGATYDEARRDLLQSCDAYPGLKWVRAWLEDNRPIASL